MESIFISLLVFIIVMLLYLIINKFAKKQNKTISDRLFTEENEKNIKKENKTKMLNKLKQDLLEAKINIEPRIFILIVITLSIVVYIVSNYVFKQPFVSFAPLPFTLYFIPQAIIETKKNKEQDKFDSELVQILRRMSSTLKNGSILQALEDVKDLPSLSEKSRVMLNEVFHRYKYGDSIEEAFQKVAQNIGSEQFMLCAKSIDINKELGADLSESISKIAFNIQRRRLTQRETKSLMSETVMVGRVLSVIPFAIIGFVMWQNKDYFNQYLDNIINQFIFMFLFIMMFFGVYIVDKVSKKM